jgi:hypothetical protein
MRNIHPRSASGQRRLAATHYSPVESDSGLTSIERRRVAIAALGILEREHELRLAQIRNERRTLLAQLAGAG